MEIRIDRTYSDVCEAMELLRLAVNTTKAERKQETARFRNYYRDQSGLFEASAEMLQFVDEIAVTERMRYYFEVFQKEEWTCLADLMILTFLKDLSGTPEQIYRRILDVYRQYRLEDFPAFDEYEAGLTLQETRQPFWKSVRQMGLEEKYQARLLFAFSDFEQSLHEVFELMETAFALLSPLHPVMDERAEAFYEYWDTYFSQHEAKELLDTLHLSAEEETCRVLHLHQSMVMGFCFRIYVYSGPNGETAGEQKQKKPEAESEIHILSGFATFVGVLGAWINDNGKTAVQELFRTLADPSKLEILLYIKKEPHFGKEIARKFGLSTATVSYHMNELYQKNLILIRQQGKRIYYELNRDRLEEILVQAQKLLC